MPVTCTANSPLSVSHKGSAGTSIAFPDVCKTPTPAGPIPIPYPNVAQSKDTSSGSSSVKMDGQPVMLKNSNFMMSSGDEAGSAMGVVSNKIKGKLQFVNYSFDIKIEGQNVCRLGDPAQQNMGTANAMGPFHAQGPIPPGAGSAEACEDARETVEQQQRQGPETQWGGSGIYVDHRSAFVEVANEGGWIIYIRSSNPLCEDWIKREHLPKPHACLRSGTVKEGGASFDALESWLGAHPDQIRMASVKRSTLLRSNAHYSRNAADYHGVVVSLKAGPEYGRPLSGIDSVTRSVVKDSGLDYSNKWVTGDYDLMDVMRNNVNCQRLKEGTSWAQLKQDLNVKMNWDGIQHGPQSQWIPKRPEGTPDGADPDFSSSFPLQIGSWLNKKGAEPPKIRVVAGRDPFPACSDELTVVAPGVVAYFDDYAAVKNSLLCCGCKSPGDKVE